MKPTCEKISKKKYKVDVSNDRKQKLLFFLLGTIEIALFSFYFGLRTTCSTSLPRRRI